jgi:heat shock protein HspQ
MKTGKPQSQSKYRVGQTVRHKEYGTTYVIKSIVDGVHTLQYTSEVKEDTTMLEKHIDQMISMDRWVVL